MFENFGVTLTILDNSRAKKSALTVGLVLGNALGPWLLTTETWSPSSKYPKKILEVNLPFKKLVKLLDDKPSLQKKR